jgi:hypothetical protein
MHEEAEALLHSSVGLNNALQSLLTFALIVPLVDWGIVKAIVRRQTLVGNADGQCIPHLSLSLLLHLHAFAMIFFSSKFRPGSGVQGLKAL